MSSTARVTALKMQYIPRNRASFIDQLNPFVNRIFQHAVMQGDMAVVTLMLKHGIVVKRNQRNPQGLTALQQSVLDGNSRLAMMLLESGADMEAKTSNGWTCLHIASATGDMRMARLLLAHCADVVALTKTDELPIDLAMNMDMKILLANEMSRCGYIELSQWYMDKITQQDLGVFYVMSADSLLEIACERPDPFGSQGCDLHSQNYLQTYSSMINLSHYSASEMNLASHKARKPSAWSLNQQGQPVSKLGPSNYNEDMYSYTLPAHGRLEQMFSSPIDSNNLEKQRETTRKSSFSASLIEKADQMQQVTKDDSVAPRKVSYSNSTNRLAQDQPHYVLDSVQQVNSPDQTEIGAIGIGNRKNSLRRKKSSQAIAEENIYNNEASRRIELTIDYSIDYTDDNESDYLEFSAAGRPRVNSSTSGSSSEEPGAEPFFEQTAKSRGYEILYEDGNQVSGNRELLQEFADPYRSNSQFEIDTDNMDQYIVQNDGSVDRIMPNEDPDTTQECVEPAVTQDEVEYDDQSPSNGNMYFNPMYTSTDITSKGEQALRIGGIEHETSSTATSSSDQDVVYDWQVNENDTAEGTRGFERSSSGHKSNKGNKPYEIYSEETELICDETEFVERKRKKKGIISEIVSRFKKGSSKMQRTSSDTNLPHGEDCSVIRRDTRKVKTLRRRRHVRRSNSFSSYFSPGEEKGTKQTTTKKDEKNKVSDGPNKSHEVSKAVPKHDIAPPYSPHRRQKVIPPFKEPISNQKVAQMYASLPHRGSRANRLNQQAKRFENALVGFDNNWHQDFQSEDKMSWEPKLEVENGWNNDNSMNRVPVRSVNTYSREDGALQPSEGKSNESPGCVSMKLLCNV